MSTEILSLEESNLSPEIIKENVLPYYNLQNAKISIIKFKDTEKQRAVYRIDFKEKSYCLKKVYYSIEDLLYVYSATEWLYRHRIRVPKLLPTIDNNRFVSYQNMLFILTPWIEGDKCSFDNLNHVIISAEKLATIHNISRNFHPIVGSSLKKGFDDYYISTLKHFQDLLHASNEAFKYKDTFSRQFILHFDTNLQLAKLSLDIANKIETNNLSKSLCHGDYVNKNLIFPHDLDPWIIDFDKCKIDYCSKDLAYFMRRLLKRDNTKWNIQLALSVLESYHKISPLTQSDLRYIISYICFPQKYWRISRDYYKNINKCNKSAFLTLLSNAVSKTDFQYEFAISIITEVQERFNTNLLLK
ncbi:MULTISPECIES: CotS family spore coat protein [unclassified Clostridium]|uniref:CotS family spore coat protein n=1 Tax=unclassified Clostridium TaxID=2614128 RepID=UPI0002973847|nr:MULTISPECIES: CotS family spore coat protein [unclassified Clostridium]EKQ50315.1 MAG: spore coat protein, CotS family [Clostridium sp. Maddingley MBC34-26]